MWILLISLYASQNLGFTQSQGVIQAPQLNYETCIKERDKIKESWSINGYRVSPRCVWIKHYNYHSGT